MDDLLSNLTEQPASVSQTVDDNVESVPMSAGDSVVTQQGGYIELETITTKLEGRSPMVIPQGWRIAGIEYESVAMPEAPFVVHWRHVTIQRWVADVVPSTRSAVEAALEEASALLQRLEQEHPREPELDIPPVTLPEPIEEPMPMLMWLEDDETESTVILPNGQSPMFTNPIRTNYVFHGIKDDPAPSGFASTGVTFKQAMSLNYPMEQVLEIGERESREAGREAGLAVLRRMQAQRTTSAGSFTRLIPATNT